MREVEPEAERGERTEEAHTRVLTGPPAHAACGALLDYAVQRGHALSTEDLGDFVRALVERHGGKAQPTSPPTVLARKTKTPVTRPPADTVVDAELVTSPTRPMAKAEIAAALFTGASRPAEHPAVTQPDLDVDDSSITSTANFRKPSIETKARLSA